jgi:subtilisin family serine protease
MENKEILEMLRGEGGGVATALGKDVVLYSYPKEDERGLPPIIIDEILDHAPLSVQVGRFLTERGDWQELKSTTNDGKDIIVGIGDTGVDKTHLEGDLAGVKDAKDFTSSRYGSYDRHSHGSHVSGHIGARSDQRGMVGIASSCTMYHAKVLGDSGSGSTRGIASGIRWLADKGSHIISLSLGGSFSQDIEGACREAAEQGIMVFAALGNSGWRGTGHPGNSRYTFGIAAIDYDKRIASFSSRGESAHYSGYGVQVLSCGLNGKYVRMSGTSMACPDQAGIAALYLSWRKKHGLPLPTTMEELEGLYSPGIEDLGDPGHDVSYGLGFLNIWKILDDIPSLSVNFGLIKTTKGLYMTNSAGETGTFKVGDKSFTGRFKKLGT